MLAVEREQAEYRKLMQLAEELCIEGFNTGDTVEGFDDIRHHHHHKRITDGLDEEAVLQLKALCHVSYRVSVNVVLWWCANAAAAARVCRNICMQREILFPC